MCLCRCFCTQILRSVNYRVLFHEPISSYSLYCRNFELFLFLGGGVVWCGIIQNLVWRLIFMGKSHVFAANRFFYNILVLYGTFERPGTWKDFRSKIDKFQILVVTEDTKFKMTTYWRKYFKAVYFRWILTTSAALNINLETELTVCVFSSLNLEFNMFILLFHTKIRNFNSA